MKTKSIMNVLRQNQDAIFTGLSIAGVCLTAIFAAKNTLRAHEILEEHKSETNKEMIKACWKCYIPTAASAGLTITSIVMAHKASGKKIAAAVSALTISQNALRDYQEKVVEKLGENKDRMVRDAVAEKKIKENPLSAKEVIITGNGDSLVFDAYSGRYFMSSIEKLRKAENELNRRLMQEMRITLNELYFEIGLEPIKAGNDLGWDVDYSIDMDFSTQLTDDQRPCIVLDYRVGPTHDLRRW